MSIRPRSYLEAPKWTEGKSHALAQGLAGLPAAWVCVQQCLPRSRVRISAYLFCDAHLQLDIKLPFLEKADAMHPAWS